MRWGSPAPHSDTVGVLTAAARCIGPLSLVRSQRHSASPAARAGRLQRPPRSAASLPATCAVSPLSSIPPKTITRCPASARRLTIWRKRSGSPPSGGSATAGEHADKGSVEGPQRGPRFPRRVVESEQRSRRLSRCRSGYQQHVGCASVHCVHLHRINWIGKQRTAVIGPGAAPAGDAGQGHQKRGGERRSQQGGRGPRPASQLNDAAREPFGSAE